MVDKNKLDSAIKRVLNNPIKEITMADNDKKVQDSQKRVEEANQKVADSRDGSVVSQVSAFGTPSTYEDPNHPESKPIAQLDEERTQDVDKFNDDRESTAKVVEQQADERVAAAEAQVAVAESEASVKPEDAEKAAADVQAAQEEKAEKVRTAIQQAQK